MMKVKTVLGRSSRAQTMVEVAVVTVLLALAAAIRLVDFTDAPLDFHPSRQLHSAIIARAMYFENLGSVSEWQRVFAMEQGDARGLIEPPILEVLSSWGYQMLGGEHLWLPRLLSILFWLVGGLGLYLLARGMTSRLGASVSMLFYLFSPYAILASRAFMPDPLMTALMVWAVLFATRWARLEGEDRRASATWMLAVTGGLLTGFAIFAKSVAVFAMLPVWLAAVATGPGLLRGLRMAQTWVIATLSLLPSLVFYFYGLFVTGQLQQQFSGRFFPGLWVEPRFYVGWLGNLEAVIGTGWLGFSLLGALALRARTDRSILLAWWIGYVVYGFVFSWHISTHDYYTLWVVPAAAAGLGAAVAALSNTLGWRRVAAVAVVCAGLMLPAHRAYFDMVEMSWNERVSMWQEVGSRLPRDSRVVSLTDDYGLGLAYWGWRDSEFWVSSGDLFTRGEPESRGQAQLAETLKGAEFFLITDFPSFESEEGLPEYLAEHHALLAKESGYWIYDLRPDA